MKKPTPNCAKCKWNMILQMDEHSRCMAIGNTRADQAHTTPQCYRLYEEKEYKKKVSVHYRFFHLLIMLGAIAVSGILILLGVSTKGFNKWTHWRDDEQKRKYR